jgi:hypothetical protein
MPWYICTNSCEFEGKLHEAGEHYFFGSTVNPPLLHFTPDGSGEENFRRVQVPIHGYLDDEGNLYLELSGKFPLQGVMYVDPANTDIPRGIRNNSGRLEYQDEDGNWTYFGDGSGEVSDFVIATGSWRDTGYWRDDESWTDGD